jgi:hypothetical protein
MLAVEQLADSKPFELANSPFVGDVSCVQSTLRLQQDNMNLLVGYGKMFYTVGNDYEFAFVNDRFVIAEAHAQRAFRDEEQFIFVVVMMPDEFALKLYGFHLTIIDFADYPRVAVILKLAKFLRQVYGMHGFS